MDLGIDRAMWIRTVDKVPAQALDGAALEARRAKNSSAWARKNQDMIKAAWGM